MWERWQSLNVGMLAFTSSVIALNISRYNSNKQREREFVAAKAYLPATLSELCEYYRSSAEVFDKAWNTPQGKEIDVAAPNLPGDYRDIFSECIKHSEPEVADHLASILVKLQVHDARLRGLMRDHNSDGVVSPDKHNLISYLYRLGELQAIVNKLFGFARSTEAFDSGPLEWEDYRNAYGNFDIHLEDFYIDDLMNLEAFTRRAISRDAK